MRVKSFGCSFIFGTDLPDDGVDSDFPTSSKMTWPALIAQRLGLDYCCYARGGQGNLFILDQVLCHAASPDHDLFIIGWSWIDRFDYVNKDNHQWVDWKAIRPSMENTVSETYFKHIHSQYRDKLSSLIYMQTAIDVLEKKKIPFVMTCMDDIIFEKQWNITPSVSDLQMRVEPYMSTFEGSNFLHWSKQNGFPISPTWHPLQQAHEAAADVMLPRVQSLV